MGFGMYKIYCRSKLYVCGYLCDLKESLLLHTTCTMFHYTNQTLVIQSDVSISILACVHIIDACTRC